MGQTSESIESVLTDPEPDDEPDDEPDEDDLGGRWINDGGTVIDLRSHDDGRLSGTIRFAADGTTYKPFELRGTCIVGADGRAGIVGTVPGWPHPASVTVWCGDLDPSEGVMATKLLSAAGPAPSDDWETVTGGTDFRRSVGGHDRSARTRAVGTALRRHRRPETSS
jgi:hypothetical protein